MKSNTESLLGRKAHIVTDEKIALECKKKPPSLKFGDVAVVSFIGESPYMPRLSRVAYLVIESQNGCVGGLRIDGWVHGVAPSGKEVRVPLDCMEKLRSGAELTSFQNDLSEEKQYFDDLRRKEIETSSCFDDIPF